MAVQLLSVFWLASTVVPLPANGSRMLSPLNVKAFKNCVMRVNAFMGLRSG